jgi:DNA sulfur modification protein DndB
MSKNEVFFELPAVKGIQAGRPYYTVMCPLNMVARFFTYTDSSLSPDMRAQRVLNKQRIPEMKDYILQNRDSYVFSSLTASVDGDITFEPIKKSSYVGQLRIPVSARIIINDGQHRRAAIEAALEENSDLRHEDISLVLYYDLGLQRSQQMFTDLNRYAIRPTKSLNILYDNRDAFSVIIKDCIIQIPIFSNSVECEKSSISNRSKDLFTLSGIFHASKLLLRNMNISDHEAGAAIVSFWNAVADNMKEWQRAKRREISPEEFRQTYICGHAITLKAIGEIGNKLISVISEQSQWKNKLQFLQNINWNKESTELQGLVMINGRISAAQSNQRAFAEYLFCKSGWTKKYGKGF